VFLKTVPNLNFQRTHKIILSVLLYPKVTVKICRIPYFLLRLSS